MSWPAPRGNESIDGLDGNDHHHSRRARQRSFGSTAARRQPNTLTGGARGQRPRLARHGAPDSENEPAMPGRHRRAQHPSRPDLPRLTAHRPLGRAISPTSATILWAVDPKRSPAAIRGLRYSSRRINRLKGIPRRPAGDQRHFECKTGGRRHRVITAPVKQLRRNALTRAFPTVGGGVGRYASTIGRARTGHGTAAGDVAGVANDPLHQTSRDLGRPYDDRRWQGQHNAATGTIRANSTAAPATRPLMTQGAGAMPFAGSTQRSDQTTTGNITVHLAAGTVTGMRPSGNYYAACSVAGGPRGTQSFAGTL